MYDHKSDMWSLGCVLYEMCDNGPPFKAKDMKSLAKKVVTGEIPKVPIVYSDDLQKMVELLLN